MERRFEETRSGRAWRARVRRDRPVPPVVTLAALLVLGGCSVDKAGFTDNGDGSRVGVGAAGGGGGGSVAGAGGNTGGSGGNTGGRGGGGGGGGGSGGGMGGGGGVAGAGGRGGGGTGGAAGDAGSPTDRPGPVDPPDVRPPSDAPAPALPTGAACVNDVSCTSGFCTDGFCCESRCDTTCAACAMVRTGASNGLCRPELANTPCGQASCMGSTLTPAPVCNGMGGCAMPVARACPAGMTCMTTTACHTRCSVPTDCVAGLVCDMATGSCGPPKKALGQACDMAMMGGDCASGFCIDGICCDMACTGACRSCRTVRTGQNEGRCAPVMAGGADPGCPRQDPSTCGRDGTCDGMGACRRYADGTPCRKGCCSRGMNRGKLCTFVCQQGTCDEPQPMTTGDAQECPILQCCCPDGDGPGVASCKLGATCTGGCG